MRARHLRLAIAACLLLASNPAYAQVQPETTDVELNLPPDVELNALVDYVSQRLGIRILYDEEIASKKISILAPGKIPVDSLLSVLESALKMKGFILSDAGIPGWKKIEASDSLPRVALPGKDIDDLNQAGPFKVITQVFPLKHLAADQAVQLIQPFLTPQGSKTITAKDENLLIVTDFASNLVRVARLIRQIDRPPAKADVRIYKVQHALATELAQRMTQILTATQSGTLPPGKKPVQITADAKSNQLNIIGGQKAIADALELAKALDKPLGLVTKTYTPKYSDAEQIDKLAKQLLPESARERLYRSTVDTDLNLLVVQASNDLHRQIEKLLGDIDVAPQRTPSPIRFYSLRFADAQDVVATLQSITQGQSPSTPQNAGRGVRGVSPANRRGFGQGTTVSPTLVGPNNPGFPGSVPPITPAQQQPPPLTGNVQGVNVDLEAGNLLRSVTAQVTADQATNSVVVVGPPAIQRVYEDLIKFLDQRRKQVLIEAKVVILDTSDDFSLGVELSGGDRSGENRLLEFTSFGLSEVDPVSGALSLIPGRGLNWTLISPDAADVVIRALTTHRRAKVTSKPQLLVDNNSTGHLASVSEVPFTSINASQTVATTSFAGFAEAGTTIEVTPRITEGDLVQLEFLVSLNSFTGAGADGVPPPRQTDELGSSVTVPDGHTVVIGGLSRTNGATTRNSVPFLENIPVIRELTSSFVDNSSETTLFFFLRPVILRDDKFKELKFYTERSKRRVGSSVYPMSTPLLLK